MNTHQTSLDAIVSTTARPHQQNALRFSMRAFLTWMVSLPLKTLRKRQTRYRIMSPTWTAEQKIRDTTTGETFKISIRDRVDLAVAHQLFYSEDYRLQRLKKRHADILAQYRAICDADERPLIVDLGANIGLASLYFSREFPKARVVAVEPDQGNLAMARQNNAHNPNVIFVEAGISHADGRGTITNAGDENWALRTAISESGKVSMISMQSLLAKYARDKVKPFIVKIDIEGFEEDLFSAATEWVDQFPLLIIELHDWMLPGTASSNNFLRCISQLNRDFIYHGENVFSIRNSQK